MKLLSLIALIATSLVLVAGCSGESKSDKQLDTQAAPIKDAQPPVGKPAGFKKPVNPPTLQAPGTGGANAPTDPAGTKTGEHAGGK